MSAIDNEMIKTHLRTLYSGQLEIWKALDGVCSALAEVLTEAQDTGSIVPARIRTKLYGLKTILDDLPAIDQLSVLTDANLGLLAADEARK